MERDEVLGRIDAAYAARIEGDKAKLAAMCAPGARLELAGHRPHLAGYAHGPDDFATIANRLVDLVGFEQVKRLSAVVEGGRAAVHFRARCSVDGGPPFETETFDLWEIGEDGKIVSLLQFVDTARFAAELAERGDATLGVVPA